MAVRIYRWRPPEIVVTLTPGGTLAANTTYYIAGFFKRAWVYNDAESIFSNVETFTTDTVNKSISVAWKVTVSIQGFQDYGSGKTRVLATNHCLTAGDALIIESGDHAGTYTVTTWENYNSFLITKTFVSDYATTFRVETLHNTADGLMFYMHTVNPFTGDPTLGTWNTSGLPSYSSMKMSHYPWNANYSTTPVAIAAPFTLAKYGVVPQAQGTFYPPPPWCKVMEKGTIWIDCTGSATVTEIKQACIDADVLDIAHVSGDNNTLTFYGILRSTGTLTFTDMSINNYMGLISGSGFTQLTYLRCNVQCLQTTYSYFYATATYTSFMYQVRGFVGATPALKPYSWAKGSNNTFNTPSGLAAEGMSSSIQVDGMILNGSDAQWLFDCKFVANVLTNCVLNKGYLYLYYMNDATESTTWRMFNGWRIDSSQAFDISVQYNNSRTFFNLRNIDTTRTNNRKIVYTPYTAPSYTCPTTLYFYRGGTITVYDENGNVISGADVKLVNGNGTEYNYTTNGNGQAVFEVLEQMSVPPTSGNWFTQTYYDNWTLTISKNGYATYISKSILAQNIELQVTLRGLLAKIYLGDTLITDIRVG